MYDDPVEEKDARPLSAEEEARLDRINQVDALLKSPGWGILKEHLEAARSGALEVLTYADKPAEISRAQGVVHALNVLFGTTAVLLEEGALLRQLAANPQPEKPKARD